MSRHARGLMGLSVLGVATLGTAVLTLPIEWIIGFFAVTTALSVLALGLEMWGASRALALMESRIKH